MVNLVQVLNKHCLLQFLKKYFSAIKSKLKMFFFTEIFSFLYQLLLSNFSFNIKIKTGFTNLWVRRVDQSTFTAFIAVNFYIYHWLNNRSEKRLILNKNSGLWVQNNYFNWSMFLCELRILNGYFEVEKLVF